MAWSTREIADLSGTSLRAVRHYHDVGLLAEPERRANGYKQYGVAHLVRLVRIKRLTDLGFSLPQVAAMGDSDDHPEQALHDLDAELAATIERLQRARDELGRLLAQSAPTDLPPDFAPLAAVAKMTDADRSLVVVLSRVLGPRGLRVYADMMKETPDDPAATEFDNLPADADDTTRLDLAERLAPYIWAITQAHPGLLDARTDAPRGARFADRAIDAAMADLYNPAQLDVLQRATEILRTNRIQLEER
ncbi:MULTISPECIES: MerR family transcriptional regulator [unclassified Mycolicibacterium]|uniref:helix-turn-helix domain-containing protein n=1 Tax=unclassified Mycolicibacterium TaxID=2636767 RepID=UPI0012DFBA61|nr:MULTISPECIES: MerR family transcriptional regulator [unclassified Mycolicibacterium]MUL82569.1 MerR family transcriptional regulator [Mycolicibacterium sp. CBMA 329]MUL88904.1 MerR family transcriptional regulator [Mycolicibacterium sp. CBMA 331]MUL97473.1 MerR family transcriptional regulator [Mycolicibacterium sp. CBMA 334]MUM26803.1 MerR family transcriptional regulator [Mycolicibacterium sp. CBMA 295]MUM38420.1 MerR family transcriptional regulator [Mycolicibacterium sp. CBMA 247]